VSRHAPSRDEVHGRVLGRDVRRQTGQRGLRRCARVLAPCLLALVVACGREVVVGYLPNALDADAAPPVATEAGPADAGAPDARDADAALPPPEVSWPSGVHAGNELSSYADFEAFRGRPIELAMFFVDRSVGWPGLVTPGWPIDMLAELDARLVLAEPLYPEGEGNNQECATGAYDAEWRKLGPFLTERGRGDSVIRLGWGPNDSAHAWRADADPSDWIACYQHVSGAIRAGGPELEIAWDFNPAGRPDDTALDPFGAYPGDAYVDYVGIEAFDRYPPARDADAWRAKCEAPTGLCSVIEFARTHGKRLGLNEWGVVSCGDEAGGDNPFFVRETVRLLAEQRDVVGYELYYEDTTELCSTLAADGPNPLAAAEYQALYVLP
jgi:hypothetical protein